MSLYYEKKMRILKIKPLILFLISTFCLLFISIAMSSKSIAAQPLISLFPLDHYDQTLSTWIKSSDTDFDKPLLSENALRVRFDLFKEHYVGSLSPWHPQYVMQILSVPVPNDLKTVEQSIINNFNNTGKTKDLIGYGENFRPYDKSWIETIANNINLSQFDKFTYQASNRAIAVDNLQVRVLPTNDPHFYDHNLAGQGYPFDNLQMSALWIGTPVYIVSETRDRAFMLVITPDFIGWVKSNGIARTDQTFINTWTNATRKNLIAVTETKTSLIDRSGQFLSLAYVGSVFPGSDDSSGMTIMVPVANTDHNAIIKLASVTAKNATVMPLTVTPHHFRTIMQTMIGRPYGWGSLYFYNDCSAELKSLFTPFGIWLPRHSSQQVTEGKMVDLTGAAQEKRLAYLIENGQRFLTLIYVGGHIILYIGNYPDHNQATMAMTYQNMWGLSPNPATRRAVVGKSVLFPMLLQYPEDTSLTPLAGRKYFQVSFLNQLPVSDQNALLRKQDIDMKSLMYSEILFHLI